MLFKERKNIIETIQNLHKSGLFPGKSGNVSLKASEHNYLITPSNVPKNELVPGDIILLNSKGEKIKGPGSPTSELPLHLTTYRKRDDVKAIIHVHAPYATGFSVAGKKLPSHILPEIDVQVGEIPITEYATPSTSESAEAIRNLVKTNNAFLLKNHGIVTLGSSLREASSRAETVEHFAKVLFVANLLGDVEEIPSDKRELLREMREDYEESGDLAENFLNSNYIKGFVQ